MLNINLSLNWELTEQNGEKCAVCKLPIDGKMWVAFLQTGETKEGRITPIKVRYCDKCYNEFVKTEK